MRRRLPLLRTVILLTAALIAAAVILLGFVRVGRVVVAPGKLTAETAAGDTARARDGVPDQPRRFQATAAAADGALLRPGQTVQIRLEAYPWMHAGTLGGRVAAVGEAADGAIGVTIAVDSASAPGPLVDGLRGEARIATGQTDSLGRLLLSRMAGGVQ